MVDRNKAVDKLKAARSFAEGNTEAELLVVRKSGPDAEVGKLEIGRTEQNELSKLFADALTKIIDNLREGETRTRELDVANTIGDGSSIQVAHIGDLPDSPLFHVLNSRGHDGTTSYKEDPPPDFQLIRISEPHGPVLIGVQTTADAKFYKKADELALLYSNSEYERFEGDLLVLKPSLKAITFDDWVFIISPKTFERVFEMREEYQKRATEAIKGFKDSGIEFGDTKIEGWLQSQMNILRGMYEIYENDIHKKASPDTVEAIIEKYNLDSSTSIDYQRKGGKIILQLNDYAHTWKLLKLLGAKYAEDDIMDTQWEIDSGQRLT